MKNRAMICSFVANAYNGDLDFELPQIGEREWFRVVDTAQPSPSDIAEDGLEFPAADAGKLRGEGAKRRGVCGQVNAGRPYGACRPMSSTKADSKRFPIFVRQGKSKARFKVGYIDGEGHTVIDAIFDEGTRFYEGLASVRVKRLWGVINANGEFVIQPTTQSWCHFQSGVASISVKGRWGIIDASGQFVVEPKYSFLRSFKEGFAVFRTGERESKRYGYVDSSGVEVIAAIFRNAQSFSEGLAAVRLGDLWGYIEPSGVFKITPRFEANRPGRHRVEETRPGHFVGGLAPVWSPGGYGFIDRKGEFAIPGRFDDADSFCDGLACFQFNGRFGFVDSTGGTAVRPRFTYARSFSEGLAAVREAEYRIGFVPPCGFIDREGTIVIEPRFHGTQDFEHGLSLVSTEDSIGYINGVGEYVWEGAFVDYGVLL